MPRYFFHVTNDHPLAVDDCGEEFDGPESARVHAMAVARELLRNAPPGAYADRSISVVDERGTLLLTVRLAA
jgi:hypothetical protein